MLRNEMLESLIPQHFWPFRGLAMTASWVLGLSMVMCGKTNKGASVAMPSPAQSQSSAMSNVKKSEKEKSEVKEEKPAKEKSAKSKKPPVAAPGPPKSMRRKKDAPPPEDKKDEEDDNGYESCPDMTPEQLAKVVEENPK
uniref:Uncharacterized protein n=1 Tax=Bursaphelenchus xylophilus TaxID=6326 RepID=A0A1I7S9C6_BURXY